MTDFDVFITADQAWPAFERAVLGAQVEVLGGFRIFDLATPLQSDEARAVGHDWFDLLAHVLGRGVAVTLRITDFDPVMGLQYHKATWRTMRQAAALAEVAGPGAKLDITAELHPARAGLLPALSFAPALFKKGREGRAGEVPGNAPGLWDTDALTLAPVTHHQKLAVIDEQILYIGGLDLDRRRFDTVDHDRKARQTWSDVQVMVRGDPAVAEAVTHLREFRTVCAGAAQPTQMTHLARTLSAPRKVQVAHLSPRTVASEIEDVHRDAIARARHLVHIETQYFRATRLAEAMAEAAQENPDLTAILILPHLPEEVAFDHHTDIDARHGLALEAEALDILRDGFGPRLLLTSPVQPRLAPRSGWDTTAGSPVIHVHNKVLVTDDDFAFVGSANLNGRSLAWDTEIGLRISEPAHVTHLRRALIGHWWGDVGQGFYDPATAQTAWARAVDRNGVTLPERRQGLLVPFDPEAGKNLRFRVPGATEDVV